MSEATPVLIGVGVGPGDPDLITLKALQALHEAGTILVPSIEADTPRSAETSPSQETPKVNGVTPGRAEAIVLAHLLPEQRHRIRRVTFAMGDPAGVTARRQAAWEATADIIITAFDAGSGPVAFATLGDPNVYSTFSSIAQTVLTRRPDTTIQIIPGIMAMQDLAARAGISLCTGTQTLTLIPATADIATITAALHSGDTVIVYKVGRQLPELLPLLAAEGRLHDTVVGSSLGLPEERIVPAHHLDPHQSTPYLTTVLVTGRHPSSEGSL